MSFKSFDLAHDVGSVVSAMNEVITISSSLFVPPAGDPNVKFYQNIASGTLTSALGGYWQTVYDSAPTSIQSTALFDLTFGFATSSQFYAAAVAAGGRSCYQEKTKVYREMASVLLGNADSVFTVSGSEVKEAFFILVKRGIMKDELKKGVLALTLSGNLGAPVCIDAGAASSYKQTVGGDYAEFFTGSNAIGQVWYNAGVIVVPASASTLPWTVGAGLAIAWSGSIPTSVPNNLWNLMTGSTIDDVVSGLRGHITNIAFQNQTNLYSTIYFCRATNTEFNYSSNPTYVDSNQRIRVTSGSNILQSRTYITKIGLYDANDNLLAVGAVNKPITKSPDTESIYRVRLDY